MTESARKRERHERRVALDALLAQQRDELVEPRDHRLGGLLGQQPRDRQRQLAADRAVARDRDPAAQLDEPLDAGGHARVVDARPRRCCARRGRRSRRTRRRAGRSRARARRRRGRSRGGARPRRAWRGRAPGSATTRPSRTVGGSSAAPVISCPATMSITRTRSPAGPRSRSPAASGAAWTVSRTQSGTGGAANGSATPSRAATRAAGDHDRRAERRRGRRARRGRRGSRARSRRGRPARGSAPGAASPSRSASSGAIALGDRLAAHRVDVALAHEHVRLAVVRAERAVLGPVAAHELQQRAQVARVGGLAQQHPQAAPALLERLLPRRRLVVGADPGRRVGVERRRRARRARGRRRAGAARPSPARRGRRR